MSTRVNVSVKNLEKIPIVQFISYQELCEDLEADNRIHEKKSSILHVGGDKYYSAVPL